MSIMQVFSDNNYCQDSYNCSQDSYSYNQDTYNCSQDIFSQNWCLDQHWFIKHTFQREKPNWLASRLHIFRRYTTIFNLFRLAWKKNMKVFVSLRWWTKFEKFILVVDYPSAYNTVRKYILIFPSEIVTLFFFFGHFSAKIPLYDVTCNSNLSSSFIWAADVISSYLLKFVASPSVSLGGRGVAVPPIKVPILPCIWPQSSKRDSATHFE